jgi:hypothetical protein
MLTLAFPYLLESCSVFHENSFPLKMHKQFASAQIFQNQIEFPTSLECILQVAYEWTLKWIMNVILH